MDQKYSGVFNARRGKPSTDREEAGRPGALPRKKFAPLHLERIQGARILLVEDNAINRRVTAAILSSKGVIVETAANGMEGIRKLEELMEEGAAGLDAVLLDIRMPGMDGYEVSRRLRSDSRFKDLPVVALTAHAMKGVREKCIEAGMNDYVPKPIEPDRLFSTLERWIKERATQSPTGCRASTAPALPENYEIPKSLPGIDMESALRRLEGNRSLLGKIMLDFYSNFACAAWEVERAIATGKTSTAMMLAHAIKGVAGNISALELYSAANDLEVALGRGNNEQISESMESFKMSLSTVLQAAQEIKERKEELRDTYRGTAHEAFQDARVDEREAWNPARVAPLLNRLDHLLREGNLEAEDCFREVSEHLWGSELQSELEELRKHIDALDMEGARPILSRIAARVMKKGIRNGE